MSDKLALDSNIHINRIQSLKDRKNRLKKAKKAKRKGKVDKAIRQNNPQEVLKQMCKPGYYVIHRNANVEFVKLESNDKVVEAYQDPKVLSMKKVKKAAYDAWEATIVVAAKIECSPTEVLAIAEAGIKHVNKLQLSKNVKAELTKAAKAYAKCSVSIAGIFAEVGVSGEISTTISGKHLTYNAKLYAKAKAGAFVSPLGVGVFAEAEAGAEHTLEVKTPGFGSYKILPYFTIKGYVKAEAKAQVGYNTKEKKLETGASAFAGVGVSVILGAKLNKKDGGKDENGKDSYGPLGILELEGGIKVGAGAGGDVKISLGTKTEENDGHVYVCVELGIGGEMGLGLAVGFELKGTLKLTKEAFGVIKDKVIQHIKQLIKNVISKEIRKELERVAQEVESLRRIAKDKMKTGMRNVHNYMDKGLIGLEKVIGKNHTALKTELRRNVHKLETYKADCEKLKKKLEVDGLTMLDIERVMDSISDEKLKKKLRIASGKTKQSKDHIKLLQKYLTKYDRRIEKMNNFLNSEISQHYTDIERKLGKVKKIIEQITPEEKEEGVAPDKLRIKINKKLDSINVLLEEFNLISNTKEELADKGNQLTGEEVDLDTKKFIKTIKQQRDTLQEDVKEVMDIIDKYRDMLQ